MAVTTSGFKLIHQQTERFLLHWIGAQHCWFNEQSPTFDWNVKVSSPLVIHRCVPVVLIDLCGNTWTWLSFAGYFNGSRYRESEPGRVWCGKSGCVCGRMDGFQGGSGSRLASSTDNTHTSYSLGCLASCLPPASITFFLHLPWSIIISLISALVNNREETKHTSRCQFLFKVHYKSPLTLSLSQKSMVYESSWCHGITELEGHISFLQSTSLSSNIYH